jgi:FkbM family methyltransferase
VLGGEYDWPVLPDEPTIRHVIDVGANVGAFACWIYKRTGAFVDCYEPLPGAALLCAENGPPGCRVHEVAVTVDPGPVRLHVGSDWGFSSLDSRLNPRSGEVVEVPAVHPSALPPCDLLKVDTEGSEVEILGGYPHLDKVGVVMFEWHREVDRPVLEAMCAKAGLRLFKSVHDAVSIGLQVWVRSRAVNGHGRYVMPLP